MNFDYTCNHSDLKVSVAPESKKTYNKAKVIENVIFSDNNGFNTPIYCCDMFSLESRLVNIVHEYFRKRIYFELNINSIFSNILAECARKVYSGTFSYENDIAVQILDYINENYMSNLINKDIGAKFGFHPNYVSNIIKISTGVPLHKYILKIKISHAVEMLENGVLSISQIADKCGVKDIYYFSRYFKKVMGVSPNEYKKAAVKNLRFDMTPKSLTFGGHISTDPLFYCDFLLNKNLTM